MDETRTRAGDGRPWLEPLDDAPTGDGPIALLAGSFDPPTVAHVALALAWRAETAGDVILVYADRTLPKEPGTEAPMLGDVGRLEALRRLTAAHEGLHAARASHGLLVGQAEAAHDRWPAAPLTVLLGSDKVRQLLDPAWYDDRDAALGRLFAVSEVRYADRAGDEGLIVATLARPDNAPFRGRIRPIEVPPSVAAVASSEVRRRVRSGRSVAELVPPEVLSFLST